ncbi:MAG: hypothetical protein QM651_18655 [Rhodoblastus sp.]
MSGVHIFPLHIPRLAIAPLMTLRARVDFVALACAVIAACGMSEYAIALIAAARTIL